MAPSSGQQLPEHWGVGPLRHVAGRAGRSGPRGSSLLPARPPARPVAGRRATGRAVQLRPVAGAPHGRGGGGAAGRATGTQAGCAAEDIYFVGVWVGGWWWWWCGQPRPPTTATAQPPPPARDPAMDPDAERLASGASAGPSSRASPYNLRARGPQLPHCLHLPAPAHPHPHPHPRSSPSLRDHARRVVLLQLAR